MLSPRRLGFFSGSCSSSRPLLKTQDAGLQKWKWKGGEVGVAASDFGSLAIRKFFFSPLCGVVTSTAVVPRWSKQNPKKTPWNHPPTWNTTRFLAMRACVDQQTRTLRPHYWALAIIWNCKSFIHGRGIRKWKIYVFGPDKSIGAPKHVRNSQFKWGA